MLKHNLLIINEGEKNFSISPSQQFFDNSNSYLRPFKLYVEFDEDVQEYQYSIKDLNSQEILTTGWFEAKTLLEAKKHALGRISNFIQVQSQLLDNIISDIIDFRYDIINEKITEEE